MARWYSTGGYPLGPHSLVATVAQALGIDMDMSLIGLLVAIPVVTTMAALRGLAGAQWLVRALAALVVAFAYLLAAYYGEGAFKETLLALFVLAFAIALQDLIRQPGTPLARSGVPLALLVAGGLLTYSYLALAWFASALAILVLVWLAATRPSVARVRAAARQVLPVGLIALATLAVAVAAELRQALTFFDTLGVSPAQSGATGIPKTVLGNLPGPLPARETLGIWPSPDFRVAPPPDTFMFVELRLLALAALAFGVVTLLRRREAVLPATLAGAALVYLVTKDRESPYVAAKALVVMAPLVMLVIMRGLTTPGVQPLGSSSRLYGVSLAVAAIIGVGAAQSSIDALRASSVESVEQRDQLAELRPLLHGRPTLFLPIDDYAAWRLRDVPIAYFAASGVSSPLTLPVDPQKPWAVGDPADFDSVAPAQLDRFRYVVTTSAAYTSAPPPNFRRVASTRLYDLWQRTGPTPPGRRVVEPAAAPAAMLSCRVPRGHGTATTWQPSPRGFQPPPLAPGAAATVTLTLPPGVWDLSAQYQAPLPVRLQIGSRRLRSLPANTTRAGPFWPVARIRSTGKPIGLLMIADRQSRLTPPSDVDLVSALVATPVPLARQVPVQQACKRIVDHYYSAPGG